MNKPKYEVHQNPDDELWYWRFRAGNGEIMASGEGYVDKNGCLKAVDRLKELMEMWPNIEIKVVGTIGE